MSSDHLPRALEFCQQRAQRWMDRHDALRDRVPELIREAKAEAWDECNSQWAQRGLSPDSANPYRD